MEDEEPDKICFLKNDVGLPNFYYASYPSPKNDSFFSYVLHAILENRPFVGKEINGR